MSFTNFMYRSARRSADGRAFVKGKTIQRKIRVNWIKKILKWLT